MGATLVFSPRVTRSTGTTGVWSAISSLCDQLKNVAPMTPMCSSTATTNAVGETGRSEALWAIRLVLCGIGNKPDMREPRGAKHPHDLHHTAVVDGFVPANIDALVIAILRDCR